jgi:hypothetical protein
VAEALAELEGGGEALAGELALAKPQVGESAEVETVGLSPGVLAVGMLRAVERIAGVLQGFAGITSGEERFCQREAEIDRELSEAAGVRQENAGFRFGDGLQVIAQMPVEFAG